MKLLKEINDELTNTRDWLDLLIKSTMKRYSIDPKYFDSVKEAVIEDFAEAESDLREVTMNDIVEIMDASGIPTIWDDEAEEEDPSPGQHRNEDMK